MSKRPSRGVTSGVGTPTKMTGRDGDLTIRKTREGKILYVKEHGSWHPINTGVDTVKLKKDVDNLIRSVNTIRNNNNPFLTIDTLNIRRDKIKLGTDGTGLTLKNNSGALNIRNEADSADVQLAVGYGGTGASTEDGALSNLGGTATGINVFKAADQAAARSAIGAGTGSGTVTASSTDTFTNKTFDANGTGNSLSNVDMANDVTGTLPTGNGGTGLTSIDTLLNSNVDKSHVDALNITEVGALADGSITSGFGAIDNGSSNITTTGTLSAGTLHASKNFTGISNNSIVKISGTTTAPGSPTSEATINALEIVPIINATPPSGANTQTFNLIKADLTETDTTSFDVVNLLDIQVTDSGGSKTSKFKINNTGAMTSTGTAANSDGSSGDNRYLHITTDGLIGYRTAAQIKADVGGTAASSTFTDVTINGTDGSTALQITSSADTGDLFKITTNAHGATTIQTVDDDATAGHLTLEPNGILKCVADDGGVSIKETASAGTDTASFGQVWVKNSTPNELCFTDDAGTDITGIGKYIYDVKYVGYNSSSSAASYLPMNGYIIEGTSQTGRNEYQAFVAPYNGTLEKIMWRSEIAQDGTFRNLIWESTDGTEVPGTIHGRWDVVVDVADDTTVEFDYTATPTSGTNVLTKGRIYAISIDPVSAPQDTNATIVFKWDITS